MGIVVCDEVGGCHDIRIAVLIRLAEVARLGMSSIFVFKSAFGTLSKRRERPELGREADITNTELEDAWGA